MRLSSRFLVTPLLIVFPTIVYANFAWPPAFYMYTYAIWWVVLSSLLIEGLVYFKGLNLPFKKAVLATLAMNFGSAVGGVAFSFGSSVVIYIEVLLIPLFWISAPLIYAITVIIEYLVAVKIFQVPKSKRTLIVIGLANIPTVSLAIWQTLVLTGEALSR